MSGWRFAHRRCRLNIARRVQDFKVDCLGGSALIKPASGNRSGRPQRESRKTRKAVRRKSSVPAPRDPKVLVNRLKPGQTPEVASADMLVTGLASNMLTSLDWAVQAFGSVDATACRDTLASLNTRVVSGDLGDLETLLTAQAISLNGIFTNLAHRAAVNADVTMSVDFGTRNRERGAMTRGGRRRRWITRNEAAVWCPGTLAATANPCHRMLVDDTGRRCLHRLDSSRRSQGTCGGAG